MVGAMSAAGGSGPAGSGRPGAGAAADGGLSAADRYAELVDELAGAAGVTPPEGGRGFGRSALKFRGRIFAMLVRGHLVLKLPAGRVAELAAAGQGVPFDANKGTPMREWLSLDAGSPADWLALAREALIFAGGAA
jgi:hypothetical protein